MQNTAKGENQTHTRKHTKARKKKSDHLTQSEHLAHIFIRENNCAKDVRLMVLLCFGRIWQLRIDI